MGKRSQMMFEQIDSTAKRSKPSTMKYRKVYQRRSQLIPGSKSLAQFIKTVISRKAEHKEIDVYNSYATAALNATQSNLYLINGVAEGSDYNQRVGRSVSPQYVELSVGISNKISNVVNPVGAGDYGFWALIYDRNPEGALPVFADIFDQVTASTTPAPGACFRTTASNQDRFQVLCREEWAVGCCNATGGAQSAASGAQPYHIKKHVDLTKILRGRDKTQNFNTTTAVIAAIDSGAIYFVIASTLSSATDATNWTANTKYRFTDV